MHKNQREIKKRLDYLAHKYNVPEFAVSDPVQFPRRYNRNHDIEISGLITSVISWGKREMILKNADRILEKMNHSPYDFIMNKDWMAMKDSGINLHRTFFEHDLYQISKGLYDFYKSNTSLEVLFSNSITEGLSELSSITDSKHIASPDKKSPCKRTNLFLRWMVRQDGIVDIGIWKNTDPSSLIIPLDVHVGRTARSIWTELPGSNSMKTALSITEKLRELHPDDPCLYDYALFVFGVEGMK
ncbi:MAG: TIGR02757 family protein [Bacteroidales bacterium]